MAYNFQGGGCCRINACLRQKECAQALAEVSLLNGQTH